ncbi:ArsA family ATPase [Chamaesiphon sp. VAR_48_metabat_135_sub]|uniref:Get3/ArsA fold putative tail anchor-mediating ATPase NosAFP n=1 Tax=Chamaesiphon sp. VAR_48_metabat_135_sub TaxID=2964699 RepID=UPI00286D3625|nr:ArsA family ATPase [Chamaesiphon sp. VAR_48_metabat_135_sub]
MPQILTFLGKGGSGRTTVAIAAAKQQANLGRRVLFVSQDPTPATGILLGVPLADTPQSIGANLEVVSISATVEIERGWEEVKQVEARYLRSPILRNVYGQELAILPGMDSAIALNALRKYDASGKYDVIVYDGSGDMTTLSMAGMPDNLGWYLRRFIAVVEESDLWKTISPIMQPTMAAILTVAWTGESVMSQPIQEATTALAQVQAIISNPQRVVGYLVTNDDLAAVATAKYFWGSAQQSGLTIGGVIINQGDANNAITAEFDPLAVTIVPTRIGTDWQPLVDALPDFSQAVTVPKPMTIDIPNREVRLYLPGFDKTQVKLTQSGPEVTIEAGDRRRNILLPPPLKGSSVTGAKFQAGYLIISF